jgi:hypothetical protein
MDHLLISNGSCDDELCRTTLYEPHGIPIVKPVRAGFLSPWPPPRLLGG